MARFRSSRMQVSASSDLRELFTFQGKQISGSAGQMNCQQPVCTFKPAAMDCGGKMAPLMGCFIKRHIKRCGQ